VEMYQKHDVLREVSAHLGNAALRASRQGLCWILTACSRLFRGLTSQHGQQRFLSSSVHLLSGQHFSSSRVVIRGQYPRAPTRGACGANSGFPH
jgi:hypothetical protein